MGTGTPLGIHWIQLSSVSTTYLWAIFILLQGPVIVVGRQASPNPDLLIEGGNFRSPLRALEMNPNSGPTLFKHWGEETKRDLRKALYWDFLFIPLYVSSGFIACLLASRYFGGNDFLSLVFLLTMPAAGLFDFVENLIMLQVIKETTTGLLIRIARISTFFKFALIGIGFVYALSGLLSCFCVKCFRH